ncbi:hypothetical protein FWK35_00016123, partial [Aphis craccivora]
RVTLKKHLEQHDKFCSGLEAEQSAYETANIVHDVEIIEADLVNEENEYDSDESNISELASDLI